MPLSGTPRILVPFPSGAFERVDAMREAGGEPVPFGLPVDRPAGGVALHREWVADLAQAFCSANGVDALFVGAAEPAALAGLLISGLRLDLPVVVAPTMDPFGVALAALGFAPLAGDAARIVVEAAGLPRSRELVDGFALSNALRAGLAAGAGPELLVHLAAIAREAGTAGFAQMIRVLAPESPVVASPGSPWLDAHGATGLLAHLGATLHDTPTVAGRLKESLPPTPEGPPPVEDASRLVFVRGRASGAEILCRSDGAEIPGSCRVFLLEEDAVRAVEEGRLLPSDLLVVAGCGPRGGPGLLRLDRLWDALSHAGLSVPVLTDGVPPEGARGAWASLATPEAVAGGVIGRLRDGDPLRLDLSEKLIRTGVLADEILRREPSLAPTPTRFGYAARYARSALPALEGAGLS